MALWWPMLLFMEILPEAAEEMAEMFQVQMARKWKYFDLSRTDVSGVRKAFYYDRLVLQPQPMMAAYSRAWKSSCCT